LLQRYLPFWLANLVDRLWVMLVPLIALLVPLFKVAPSIYRWRVRSRIYRLYAGLKELELELEKGGDEDRLQELLADVIPLGGRGLILVSAPLDPAEQDVLLNRFRSDRDHEYSEFSEQCHAFLAEVEKETAREKFTFAELEELDEDLKKLTGWLQKIQNRDFFSAPAGTEAVAALQRCRNEFEQFAAQVYALEAVSGNPG
jgi:hypothetical protein